MSCARFFSFAPPICCCDLCDSHTSSLSILSPTQWANNEAQARLDLQAAGKLDKPEFGTLYNTPEGTGVAGDWDDFMTKSIKPGEDDDDDDEDDDDDGDDDDDEDDEDDE